MLEPKICECGAQGKVVDSRQRSGFLTRRYGCPECGTRWSTCEVRVDHPSKAKSLLPFLIKQVTVTDKEAIADKLIALAQEILYGVPTKQDLSMEDQTT